MEIGTKIYFFEMIKLFVCLLAYRYTGQRMKMRCKNRHIGLIMSICIYVTTYLSQIHTIV